MDERSKIFSLRYVGRRFNGGSLPLEVLSDLPALRDLIAALAKFEFKQQNPDRKRVPQGFDKSISFALVGVKDGSAIPVLALQNEVAQQNLPNIGYGMEEIVARAYERVGKIFDDAAHGKYPAALPQDAVRALSKLGENIHEGEYIEFQGTKGADGNVVSLDFHRRKNILTRIRETYTVEFEGVGTLTGIDASHNLIQIQTEKYGEIRLPLNGVSMPADQFDGSLYTPVEFSVSVALDAQDQFKAIEEVYSADLVRPYDEAVKRCLSRLQELSKLERGWLGGDQGEQLVHLAGVRATQLIFSRADLAHLFRIFPTEEGGVSIEFDKNEWSFAVEIMADGSLELDGSSKDGEAFDILSFDGFTEEFFKAFDKMTQAAFNDENQ